MPLYKFQEGYLENMPAKHIMAADTGTGKSIMALERYRRHAYPKPLLIVAPAAKIRTEDWQREVATHFGDKPLSSIHYYSYEKFSRNPTIDQYRKSGDDGLWRAWLRKYPAGGYHVIADECHRLANPSSGIGRAMFQVLQKADSFSLLSATPLPNGWISAVNYFKIFGLTPGITTFKRRYCHIQTYKGYPEIVEYWREGELRQFWSQIATPLRKEDCLDLPPLTEVEVTVPLGASYKKIQKERLFEDKFLDNPSALAHALRQATIDNKLPWLDEFIEGASDHVVIFYTYVAEREAILSLLSKKHKGRRVYRQDGEKHQVPPRGTWEDIPPRSLIVAQYQSGSTGLEMQFASTIVFFSPTYSYALYSQSIGRIERIGQRNTMTLYKLVTIGSIERAVWRVLERKEDFDEKQWIIDNRQQKTIQSKDTGGLI